MKQLFIRVYPIKHFSKEGRREVKSGRGVRPPVC
jgi:hypothetical protein